MMKHFGLIMFVCLMLASNQAVAQDIDQVCAICKGHGTQECSLCEGKGKWKVEVDGKKKKVDCPECKGTEVQQCWLCRGSGKNVTVKTPNTSCHHPEGYSWLWCAPCKHVGVIPCTRCEGRGKVYAANGEVAVCSLCDGRRYVLCSSCKGTCGWYAMRVRCEVCEGSGSLTCSDCNGRGWLPPERVERAFAEVCKQCKGYGMIPHKECGGKGCKHCKNGKLRCRHCDGHGAVIMTPEPKFKACDKCSHKGVQRCNACSGKGYRNITEEGISI